jgi:hypothetical protein
MDSSVEKSGRAVMAVVRSSTPKYGGIMEKGGQTDRHGYCPLSSCSFPLSDSYKEMSEVVVDKWLLLHLH